MARRWTVIWADGKHTFEVPDHHWWETKTLLFDGVPIALGPEVVRETDRSFAFEIAGHSGALLVAYGLSAHVDLQLDGLPVAADASSPDAKKPLSERLKSSAALGSGL